MSDRRPYRVVFVRDTGGRPGTIVARCADTAHDEAQRIAASGGTARVEFVHPDGRRETVATYQDAPPPA